MFPFAAIAAANLLNSNKGTREPNPPKIETLSEYTNLDPKDFFKLLVERSEECGIMETIDIISNWQGFDNLSPKKKARFVDETLFPEKYTFMGTIKRFFNLK